MDFAVWPVWRKGQPTTPSVCHWTETLTEPWQVLLLPPCWRALIHHSPNKAYNAQTSSDARKRRPRRLLTYSHEKNVPCRCTSSRLRKALHSSHQSRRDKTSGVRFTQLRAHYIRNHCRWHNIMRNEPRAHTRSDVAHRCLPKHTVKVCGAAITLWFTLGGIAEAM